MTTPLIPTVSAIIALSLVAGCGGGGGVRPQAPSQPGGEGTLPAPQDPSVALRTETSGPSAARVADYLRVHASGGPWDSGSEYTFSHPPGLVRFAARPVVRVADTSTAEERAQIAYAVALINRALPYEQHLAFGPVAPADMYRDGDWQRGLPGVPDGSLFVKFTDTAPQGGRPGSEALGHQHTIIEYDAQQDRFEKKRLRAAAVEMSREEFRSRAEHEVVSVLVHEMLHGLGFAGHPDCGGFSDSNMCNAWFRLDGSLPAIDAAAVQVLYTRLGEATEPEDLSVGSLGSWSRQSQNLSGSLGGGAARIAFGVRHGNGVSMPWTSGSEPATALTDNRRLAGTATWDGELLGFTPALRSVRGSAEIGVDLATMDGTAAFTRLQSYAAGAAPGALGTGTTWGTGELRYSIAVGGNYLRSTGGDDGTVNGRFVGGVHQSVVGSIERDDLTAAFGGMR